jgi:Peptidase inhibitor I78 family
MRLGWVVLAAVGALGGCATMKTEVSPDMVAVGPLTCDAQAAQSHLGKRADPAVGAAILKDSGALTLRWGPPNAAWTMDYREDRVNVRYDAAMTIIEITCG